MIEGLVHDLRFGVRSLLRKPGFTLIAVVTLALGIGVNLVMLSFTSTVLFGDLPFARPEEVMVLWRETPALGPTTFSIPTFRDWQERNRVFSHMGMFRPSSQNLSSGGEEPERTLGLMVSAEMPQALGVEPVLGRSFRPEDDRPGAERTVMLSYGLWQRRFGGDPAILEQTIVLDNEAYSVIGVLPPGIEHEKLCNNGLGDLWFPIGIFFDRLAVEDRASREEFGVGRLKPGVTVEAARADMARIHRELAREHPSSYHQNSFSGALLRDHLTRDVRPTLRLLLATVIFVLLIACVNLVNLLLTRVVYRRQELATRTALGASRRRLIRQLLTESLLLAFAGGAVGLFAAQLCTGFLRRLPYGADVHIDAATVLYMLLLVLVSSLLIGLVPALLATRVSWRAIGIATPNLSRNTLPQQGLRHSLVAIELSMALVLLIGAGLMVSSLHRLQTQDPGFATARVLTLKVVLPQATHIHRESWKAFFDQALTRLRALPEIEGAAVATLRPLEGDRMISIFTASDREIPGPSQRPLGVYQLVSPDYFRTLDIPLVAGRDFGPLDNDAQAEPVVMISESVARLLWPDGESPLGKTFAFEFSGTVERPVPRWRRIVGVVGDVRNILLTEAPRFAVYAPYTQSSPYFAQESPVMTFFVKTRQEPAQAIDRVRAELLDLDSHQPVYSIMPLRELIEDQLEQPRVASWLLSLLTALALVLAIVGVYGVLTSDVAARTREIGIRMALGASPGQILSLLLRQALKIVVAGIAVGLIAALILTRVMSSLLYGIEAIDLVIFFGAALLLSAVAMVATLVPALRATKVQPSRALRYE